MTRQFRLRWTWNNMADAISDVGDMPQCHSADGSPRLEGVVDENPEYLTLEERLQEWQKLAVIGQLAGGVAHDFNNSISATLIHLGLLLKDPQLTATQRESLKTVEKEATRAAELTRQLLSFSRRGHVVKAVPLELNAVVGGILKLARCLVRESIEVIFQPSPDSLWINADIGLVEQLVMNLCLLLREEMPKGGKLLLETARENIDDFPAASSTSRRPGHFVVLCISNEEYKSRFAQKNASAPSSDESRTTDHIQLRVDTVHDIARQHGGWLETHSDEGLPFAFRLYFPAVSQPGKDLAEPDEIRGGAESILLVEDETILRRVSTLCLRRLGYAVHEAGDGVEALQIWKKHHQNIDLLFTDLLLPGTEDGLDLAMTMRSEKPSLEVIISSGNGADFGKDTPIAGREITHVTKPYSSNGLARIVRECLDKAAKGRPA